MTVTCDSEVAENDVCERDISICAGRKSSVEGHRCTRAKIDCTLNDPVLLHWYVNCVVFHPADHRYGALPPIGDFCDCVIVVEHTAIKFLCADRACGSEDTDASNGTGALHRERNLSIVRGCRNNRDDYVCAIANSKDRGATLPRNCIAARVRLIVADHRN